MSLMPDITEMLFDEDIGGNAPFQIVRKTATRQKGRDGVPTVEIINASGTIRPSGVGRLSHMEVADMKDKTLVLRTTTPLQDGMSTSTGDVMPDEIIYNGEHFKILQTGDWSPWGMYVAYIQKIESGV